MRISITIFTFATLIFTMTLIGMANKTYAISSDTVDLVASEFQTKVSETAELINENKGILTKIWEAIKEFFTTIFNSIFGGEKSDNSNSFQDIKDKVSSGVNSYVTDKAKEQVENILNSEEMTEIQTYDQSELTSTDLISADEIASTIN